MGEVSGVQDMKTARVVQVQVVDLRHATIRQRQTEVVNDHGICGVTNQGVERARRLTRSPGGGLCEAQQPFDGVDLVLWNAASLQQRFQIQQSGKPVIHVLQ